jgi:hypothetical protein
LETSPSFPLLIKERDVLLSVTSFLAEDYRFKESAEGAAKSVVLGVSPMNNFSRLRKEVKRYESSFS